MCSIRALWILREDGSLLLSRRFSSVERRVRLCHEFSTARFEGPPDSPLAPLPYAHGAIPSDDVFLKLFRNEYLENFNRGSTPETPVTELSMETVDTVLWPVAIVPVQHLGVFLVAVPAVDGAPPTVDPALRAKAIQLPCVTATVSLLHELIEFLVPYAPTFSTSHLAELQWYLSSAMPFGTPVESNSDLIKEIHNRGFSASDTFPPPSKRPSWKAYVQRRARQRIDLHVREEVRVMQYGRPNIPDVLEASGTIVCKADLAGVPDVSLMLSNTEAITHLFVHDSAVAPPELISSKITFNPPLRPFNLCRYGIRTSMPKGVSNMSRVPINGLYQLHHVSPQHVELKLRLKITLEESGDGRYLHRCEVRIPFKKSQRGCIARHTLVASTGTLRFDMSRRALIWSPGRKFRTHFTDAVLSGSVYFDPPPALRPAPSPTAPGVPPTAPALGIAADSRTGTVHPTQGEGTNAVGMPVFGGHTGVLASQYGSVNPYDVNQVVGHDGVLLASDHSGGHHSQGGDRGGIGGRPDDAAGTHDGHDGGESKSDPSSRAGASNETPHRPRPPPLPRALRDRRPLRGDDESRGASAAASGAGGIGDEEDDPMFTGQNCYVQVFFRFARFTLSGMTIDPNAVSVHPSANAVVSVDRELSSKEFLIWNAFGDARHVAAPRGHRRTR